jgi:hypothetical protein
MDLYKKIIYYEYVEFKILSDCLMHNKRTKAFFYQKDVKGYFCSQKKVFGNMNIPDHISESLETISWVKKLKFFDANPDPGSGFRDGKIRIRAVYPGSEFFHQHWLII